MLAATDDSGVRVGLAQRLYNGFGQRPIVRKHQRNADHIACSHLCDDLRRRNPQAEKIGVSHFDDDLFKGIFANGINAAHLETRVANSRGDIGQAESGAHRREQTRWGNQHWRSDQDDSGGSTSRRRGFVDTVYFDSVRHQLPLVLR